MLSLIACQSFVPNGSIRIDRCELIGRHDKGYDSIQRDACGTVQQVRGVPGGQLCVTYEC